MGESLFCARHPQDEGHGGEAFVMDGALAAHARVSARVGAQVVERCEVDLRRSPAFVGLRDSPSGACKRALLAGVLLAGRNRPLVRLLQRVPGSVSS